MQKIKVLFFTNIPSPYRMEFFNQLGMLCDLTVLFERREAEDRDSGWMQYDEKQLRFHAVFLKGWRVNQDSAFCPSVCKYWNDDTYNIRIVGDYATMTGMYSIAFMRRKKIPFIIECDGGSLREHENILKSCLKRYLISNAQYAFSPGRCTDDYLTHYKLPTGRIMRYHFASLTKTDLVSADKARNNRDTYRQKMGIEGKKMVLFVGQIIERKGVDILIEAASLLPKDYRVSIVGGDLPDCYREQIRSLSVNNIIIEGFKQKDELPQYYASADIFVLPTREDIWGLVIAEAMSYSLPVITTKKCVAGVELLSGQTNALIEDNNAIELADSIKAVLQGTNNAQGKRNRLVAEEYTIEAMTEDHINAFKRILNI